MLTRVSKDRLLEKIPSIQEQGPSTIMFREITKILTPLPILASPTQFLMLSRISKDRMPEEIHKTPNLVLTTVMSKSPPKILTLPGISTRILDLSNKNLSLASVVKSQKPCQDPLTRLQKVRSRPVSSQQSTKTNKIKIKKIRKLSSLGNNSKDSTPIPPPTNSKDSTPIP